MSGEQRAMMTEKPLIERLRDSGHCRRCRCSACERSGFENHDHRCTDGHGCVETREKLRKLTVVLGIRCAQAANALSERGDAFAALEAGLREADAELSWLTLFADVRSRDDSKTFVRVNRGALRTISERASVGRARIASLLTGEKEPS